MHSISIPQHAQDSGDPFGDLFLEAEKSRDYWVAGAKHRFTEEMLRRMDDLGVSKKQLADLLGVKPTQISRLCRGDNNFTLETMVSVGLALDSELETHLRPKGAFTQWLDLNWSHDLIVKATMKLVGPAEAFGSTLQIEEGNFQMVGGSFHECIAS